MGEKDPENGGIIAGQCLGNKEGGRLLPVPMWVLIHMTSGSVDTIVSCPKQRGWRCHIGTSFSGACSPDLSMQTVSTYTSSVDRILHQPDSIHNIPPAESGEPVQYLSYQ